MNAIDTNVYVYALDSFDAEKQRRAVELIDRLSFPNPQTIQLWQVACEFLGQLRKRANKSLLTGPQAEASFKRFLRLFPLVKPSENSFGLSFDLQTRYSLSHWDSLLIAACQEAGVTTLYSEDMQAGANYNGVQIVNPFL